MQPAAADDWGEVDGDVAGVAAEHATSGSATTAISGRGKRMAGHGRPRSSDDRSVECPLVATLPLLHPRLTLAAAATRPSLPRGTVVVVASGVVSLALDLAGAVVGNGGSAAVLLSVAVPFLYIGFWLASALLVGAGARLVGWAPRRRDLLAVSGLTFWVLTLFALIVLLQALSPHLGGDTVSQVLGWLALPVVCWFVALNALATVVVYRDSPMAAVAIALLPYAVLSGLLLLLIVVLSGLHAAGLV